MSLVGVPQLHPKVGAVLVALDWIALDLSGGDVDLTDPAGPTHGISARAILVGSTAGNVKVDTFLGAGRVIPLAANQQIPGYFVKVYATSNGTSAAVVLVGI